MCRELGWIQTGGSNPPRQAIQEDWFTDTRGSNFCVNMSSSNSLRNKLSPSTSSMRSPSSLRLTAEFESAMVMEAEEPIRFGADLIPGYLSNPGSSGSSSDFDTQSENSSNSTSFCDLDSHRITLGSLIGLPLDSFRHFGESFRFLTRGGGSFGSASGAGGSSSRTVIERPSGADRRRSRSCSLLADIFACLRKTRNEYINNVPKTARNNHHHLTALSSFSITEVSEEEELEDAPNDSTPKLVYENSVFIDRPGALGTSRIFELNPLYISDAISEVGSSTRSLMEYASSSSTTDLEWPKEVPTLRSLLLRNAESALVQRIVAATSGGQPRASSSTRMENVSAPHEDHEQETITSSSGSSSRNSTSSNVRTILTTVCCRIADSEESQSD